jgi:hypothetical protein
MGLQHSELSKQRCPHTGIVNYFSSSDPFISVASITQANSRKQAREEFHWRIYAAKQAISGIAGDMQTAEQRLKLSLLESGDDQA